jgi:surface carbohydrate biosynthesis protein
MSFPLDAYLYLPIETSSRELDSRLLMAAFAVDRGFEVILGQKWLLHDNIPYMRPGVLLTKTLTSTDARFMQVARRHGYRTASIDEEIPGLVATRQGLRWVMRAAVDAAELIFAVGEDHHRALLEKFPDRTDRFHVTGNPRWDLLRPELRTSLAAEVERLRRAHGRFFLINTNFGLTNATKGGPEAIIRSLVRSGRIDPGDPGDRAFIDSGWRLELANVACIKDVLRELPHRFPEHRVILRPHPGERLGTWRDFTRSLPRTTVIREGAAAPWIMAAEALIHTNCTTGVEAFALGMPAFCLRPVDAPLLESFVAGRVNPIVRSPEELFDQLRNVAAGASFSAERQAAWRREFDSFIAASEGPLAAERMIDVIVDRFFGGRISPEPATSGWRHRKGYRGRIRRTRSRLSLMPDIDTAAIARRLDDLAGRLDLPCNLLVEPCGDRMFHVHAGAPRRRTAVPPMALAIVHRLAKTGRRSLRRSPPL